MEIYWKIITNIKLLFIDELYALQNRLTYAYILAYANFFALMVGREREADILQIIHEQSYHLYLINNLEDIVVLFNNNSFLHWHCSINLPSASFYLNINLACLFWCLFVCLYPINVKTAEPIGPKFFVGPHVTPTKVYEWSKF